MSDVERSEPVWRGCEGSSERLLATTEFAKLAKGGLNVLDLGNARDSRAGDRALAAANFPLSF